MGLGTWLWAQPGQELTVNLTLGGYELEVTAEPSAYHWEVTSDAGGAEPGPDPPASYSSESAGSEEEPAATHVFNHDGDYVISHTVDWSGSYTFTGFGVSESADLGTISLETSDDIEVLEVQAVTSNR